MEKISGIILAGGSASRVNGRTKPKIVINGKSIISRTLSVIEDLFDEIIIVTNTPAEYLEFSNCKITGDMILNAGPLGGIHAGLTISSNDSVFVFAGDMPFLDKKIITEQIEYFKSVNCDVVIPCIGDFIEPLHSIYRISVAGALNDFLEKGSNRAVRDFIKLLNVRYMEFEASQVNRKAFTNVNSLSDINSIEIQQGTN